MRYLLGRKMIGGVFALRTKSHSPEYHRNHRWYYPAAEQEYADNQFSLGSVRGRHIHCALPKKPSENLLVPTAAEQCCAPLK
jgi:hypothetical protein